MRRPVDEHSSSPHPSTPHQAKRLPIVVFGGSDGRPGPTPVGLTADDVLTGYKGAAELAPGRALVAELVDRLRRSERFADPVLLGPREVYESLVDCEIVDARGHLGDTLSALRTLIRERYDLNEPIAVCTYDVLPTPEELREVVDDHYAPAAESHFWWQLVDASLEAMGASDWKQAVPVKLPDRETATPLFPGHLVVVRPAALRMRLLNEFLHHVYRNRTHVVHRRYARVAWGLFKRLLREDVRNLFRVRCPTLALGVPLTGLRAYFALRRGRLTLPRFERDIARLFVHRGDRSANDGRSVVVSLVDTVSLAKDIDSKIELEEARRAFATSNRDAGW